MTLPTVRPRPPPRSGGGIVDTVVLRRYFPYVALGTAVLALIGLFSGGANAGKVATFHGASGSGGGGYPLADRTAGGAGGGAGSSSSPDDTDEGGGERAAAGLLIDQHGSGSSQQSQSQQSPPRSLMAVTDALPYRAGGDVVDLRAKSGGDAAAAATAVTTFLNVYQPRDRGWLGVEADHRRMAALVLAPGGGGQNNEITIRHVAQDAKERRAFLEQHGAGCYDVGRRGKEEEEGNATAGSSNNAAAAAAALLSAHDALVEAGQPHLATELWKYCALSVEGGAYLDPGTDAALLATFRDAFLIPTTTGGGTGSKAAKTTKGGGGGNSSKGDDSPMQVRNVAILGDSRVSFTRGTAHGSLLVLNGPNSPVAGGMVKVLVETDVSTLAADPTVPPALCTISLPRT